MVLKISPTASGVVVCCRTILNASCCSAGTASSSQNSAYGSSSRPSRPASIGVSRWWASCSRWTSLPYSSRTLANSSGTVARYFSVLHASSAGSPSPAGS
ncbi:hypothetical protein GCM10020001_001320 [Nonomuraea salmonea]